MRVVQTNTKITRGGALGAPKPPRQQISARGVKSASDK